ncbi:MAG TPA: hypothetical protein VG937_00695 [Polyangiaceae bacterium]|nr:hypothetical protein [Polyangiaceae bacterium]
MTLQGCTGAEYTEESVDSSEGALAASCYASYGLNPSKAALAVAMATELGRWDPLNDLEVYSWGLVRLKSSAVCVKNSCKQTKAILGQQDFTPDQSRFSNTNFAADLVASFERQKNLIQDLTNNHRDQLPPAHKLKLVGGPTNLGVGACGPHFIFQVDNVNGTALTSAQAALMSNTLCYFGQNTAGTNCGDNSFVGFTKTQVNCPAGRVCVAIDPDDGDAGSGTTTTAGSAPTYTLNRLWDPSNTKLNTACTKTSGPVGAMQSKCSTAPNTCGYLYCM